ncbi:MAG: fumarylacetoacetate hydrolase family protein [Sphingomonadales bacterium]|nr:fumarylacetoacetate hydrolase family protein [Sphingomonadales bacterium]
MAKYLRYELGGAMRYGRLDGTTITPLSGTFPDFQPSGEPTVERGAVKLLAPTEPTRIVSCGPGFKCSFPDGGYPDMPAFWHKPLAALNHHEGIIELPSSEYPGVNHEVELGIVIGSKAKCVSPEQAGAHIFGYTCYNDVTRGDFYEEGAFGRSPYFVYGKTYEGFAPIGPWVVTDLDTSDLHLECRINGEVRQSHSTADRLFTPEQLVSFVSHLGTLNPGDVISCGSPPGMSWMQHGDVCEIEIEGIGTLRNHVRMRGQ